MGKPWADHAHSHKALCARRSSNEPLEGILQRAGDGVVFPDIPDKCLKSWRTVLDAGGVSKARLIITTAVIEGRRPGAVATTYRVARSWVYGAVARYRTEGEAAFEPRSRRPNTSPRTGGVTTRRLSVLSPAPVRSLQSE
jgi:helix-turn-helix protein